MASQAADFLLSRFNCLSPSTRFGLQKPSNHFCLRQESRLRSSPFVAQHRSWCSGCNGLRWSQAADPVCRHSRQKSQGLSFCRHHLGGPCSVSRTYRASKLALASLCLPQLCQYFASNCLQASWTTFVSRSWFFGPRSVFAWLHF